MQTHRNKQASSQNSWQLGISLSQTVHMHSCTTIFSRTRLFGNKVRNCFLWISKVENFTPRVRTYSVNGGFKIGGRHWRIWNMCRALQLSNRESRCWFCMCFWDQFSKRSLNAAHPETGMVVSRWVEYASRRPGTTTWRFSNHVSVRFLSCPASTMLSRIAQYEVLGDDSNDGWTLVRKGDQEGFVPAGTCALLPLLRNWINLLFTGCFHCESEYLEPATLENGSSKQPATQMQTRNLISNDEVNVNEFLPLAATMVPNAHPVQIDGEQNRHSIDSGGDQSDSTPLDDNNYDFINKTLEAAGVKVEGSSNLILFSEHFFSFFPHVAIADFRVDSLQARS